MHARGARIVAAVAADAFVEAFSYEKVYTDWKGIC